MRSIKLRKMNKKGSEWSIFQIISFILIAIFIVLVLYGVVSGQLQPLFKKVAMFFDMVLVQLKIKKVDVPANLNTKTVEVFGVGNGTLKFDIEKLECGLTMDDGTKYRLNLQKGVVEVFVGAGGESCDSDLDMWCVLGTIEGLTEKEFARKMFAQLLYRRDHLFIDLGDAPLNGDSLQDLHLDSEGCLWVQIGPSILDPAGAYEKVGADSSVNGLYKKSNTDRVFTRIGDLTKTVVGRNKIFDYQRIANELDGAFTTNPAAVFNQIKVDGSDVEFPPQFSCYIGKPVVFYVNAKLWGINNYFGVSNENINGKPIFYIGDIKPYVTTWQDIAIDIKNWKKITYTPKTNGESFETSANRYYYLNDNEAKAFSDDTKIKDFLERNCR